LVELCSKDNACFYELSSKRRVIQTSSIATRKAGGTMMASKSSGCGCGDSKMQEERTCYKYVNANSQRIYDGRYTAMMKQRKETK
jgi:hypothetical protein